MNDLGVMLMVLIWSMALSGVVSAIVAFEVAVAMARRRETPDRDLVAEALNKAIDETHNMYWNNGDATEAGPTFQELVRLRQERIKHAREVEERRRPDKPIPVQEV